MTNVRFAIIAIAVAVFAGSLLASASNTKAPAVVVNASNPKTDMRDVVRAREEKARYDQRAWEQFTGHDENMARENTLNARCQAGYKRDCSRS